MTTQEISIDAINFEGHHELLNFLFNQCRSVSEMNKYNDNTTIALLKSGSSD